MDACKENLKHDEKPEPVLKQQTSTKNSKVKNTKNDGNKSSKLFLIKKVDLKKFIQRKNLLEKSKQNAINIRKKFIVDPKPVKVFFFDSKSLTKSEIVKKAGGEIEATNTNSKPIMKNKSVILSKPQIKEPRRTAKPNTKRGMSQTHNNLNHYLKNQFLDSPEKDSKGKNFCAKHPDENLKKLIMEKNQTMKHNDKLLLFPQNFEEIRQSSTKKITKFQRHLNSVYNFDNDFLDDINKTKKMKSILDLEPYQNILIHKVNGSISKDSLITLHKTLKNIKVISSKSHSENIRGYLQKIESWEAEIIDSINEKVNNFSQTRETKNILQSQFPIIKYKKIIK